MNSPRQPIRRRKAATGTGDSLSAPARTAGFFSRFYSDLSDFIRPERRLTAAGRRSHSRLRRSVVEYVHSLWRGVTKAWGRRRGGFQTRPYTKGLSGYQV